MIRNHFRWSRIWMQRAIRTPDMVGRTPFAAWREALRPYFAMSVAVVPIAEETARLV